MKKMEKFIENFPKKLASESKQLLTAFYEGRLEERDVKERLVEMVETALNTLRDHAPKTPKNIGGRNYWHKLQRELQRE